MQGTPDKVNPVEIAERLGSFPDVLNVHHVHLWTTDGNDIYLEAHIALCDAPRPDTDNIIASLAEIAGKEFGIHHVTLQPEFKRCVDNSCSGLDIRNKTQHS